MIKENIYYEEVQSPEHYNQNSIEVWEMMLQIWGYDKVYSILRNERV